MNGKAGENIKIDDYADAVENTITYLPSPDSLDTNGMNISAADLQAIASVDVDGWRKAVPKIREHYAAFGDRLPNEIATALDALESSLI